MHERICEGSCTVITIISAWYNEEFLAPLFLRHYDFADRIIIMLDESTNDGTINEIKKFMAQDFFVSFRKLKMPNGMDDQLKQRQVNDQYGQIKDGWVIEVDADEFIKIPEMGMHAYLNEVKADVVKLEFWQMYQHKSEGPLNNKDPVFEQRKYGKKNGYERWNKPCVVRAGKGIVWTVGHHEINANKNQFHDKMIPAAHWYMADIGLAIDRRIKGRKNRMSKENYINTLSAHNFNITVQKIINECEANQDCQQVFV